MGVAAIPNGSGKAMDNGGKRMDGVARVSRIGDVALFAVDGEVQVQRTAPSMSRLVAELGAAGGLADDGVVNVDAFFAQLLQYGLGAVDAVAFFVAGEQQGESAVVCGGGKTFKGDGHRRYACFHVGGATSVEVAVADGGRKWR